MSHMAREAAEAPDAVARFLQRNGDALREIGAHLRRQPPPVIITSARGSSDSAAGYFKYLTEILTGIPCSSVGASVVSVYGAKLQLKNGLCVTVSQSGKSPDIVALQDAARKAGALTVALVNVEDSPAANAADICLALHAGPELSVAATKSFIVSLVAGAAIVAHWLDRKDLLAAIEMLPGQLATAARIDWPEAVDLATGAESLYVVARGPSLPVATETALKLKKPAPFTQKPIPSRKSCMAHSSFSAKAFRFSPIHLRMARANLHAIHWVKCARPGRRLWWPRKAGFPSRVPAIPCLIPSPLFRQPIALLRRLPWPGAATPTARGFSRR